METPEWLETAWKNVISPLIILSLVILTAFLEFNSRRSKRDDKTVRYPSKSVNTKGASALLSFYTRLGAITPVGEGTVAGMHYMAYLSLTDKAVIYRVELPFGSKAHLLGVPKLSDSKQIDPTGPGSVFEKVSLEGDYDSYFGLYCQKGQQVDTRYFLDPKTMAFTVDFCQSHSWELIDSELYFAQTGRNHPDDTTSMFEDVSTFVANIRPTVERPLTQQELRKITPYGRDRRDNLKCPTCQKAMLNEQTHYRCSNHHGVLLMGRYLSELRNGKLDLRISATKSPIERSDITCPSCGDTMRQLSYNGSLIIIDSCPGCPYRWLDGADVAKIAS